MKKSILLFFMLTNLIGFQSCSFSKKKSTKLYSNAINTSPYDAIIVPGFPFENNEWDKIMRARVVWATYLYKKGYTKNIIFSGSAVYSPYYESEIMALYAEKMGVKKENVFTESKAEHSTENIYYSYKMALKLGYKKIALATDPFQSKLVNSFIKDKMNNNIDFFPIQYDILEKIDTVDFSIDPAPAFKEDFISIKEREGLWKRFQGTLGKNIDFE